MIKFNGIYRGTVVHNIDPSVKGKVKIFVHGVYPDEYLTNWKLLPWAEPAMSIAGGTWTNEGPGLNVETGWCSVPHAGALPGTRFTSICIF
jgi:hypothetical protein